MYIYIYVLYDIIYIYTFYFMGYLNIYISIVCIYMVDIQYMYIVDLMGLYTNQRHVWGHHQQLVALVFEKVVRTSACSL